MPKRKITNKNDIYLFNSIHFGDIGDYDIKTKINKLHKKLTEAGFCTKFVENTTDLDRLNKEKSNKSIRNFISDSCIFLSVFSHYFYNNDDFKKHLFIAFELGVKIVIILLEPVKKDSYDQHINKVLDNSALYPFYKAQKVADILFPIEFNSFLVDLSIYISQRCKKPIHQINYVEIEIVTRKRKKRRRKGKRRKRKLKRIGFRALYYKKLKKPNKISIENSVATKKKLRKIKNPKNSLQKVIYNEIKFESLEFQIERELLIKRKVEKLEKIKNENTTKLEKENELASPNSLSHDLTQCFKTITKQKFINKMNNSTPIDITRAIMYNQNTLLAINHDDSQLLKLNLSTFNLEKTDKDLIKDKVPYSIRNDFKKSNLLVSCKDDSNIFELKMSSLDKINKTINFKFDDDKPINLNRIWDISIDELTGYYYILDTNLKTIFVFNTRKKFHKEINLLGTEKFWPRDMQLINDKLYVVDTCTCLYDCNKSKLISFTDGGNCIRIFDTKNYRMLKCIKHKNMLRPLGLMLDSKENIFTTANFMDNYKRISPSQYLFCFNKSGKILNVISLNIDLRARGISDIVFVSTTKLIFTALSSGFVICEFELPARKNLNKKRVSSTHKK